MELQADLCIIGAGSGGLSLASGAAQLGLKVILIEENLMGGDCLNYGCVPSKALLAAAKTFNNSINAKDLGIINENTRVDFPKVKQYIKKVIKTIEPHDSVERFTKLGANVIKGHAEFIDKTEIRVNDQNIKAKKFIIATGSKPLIPTINGLDNIDFLTNENIFELDYLPKHLIVLGGGPIGCELGQAFKLLGSEVTILARSQILPKDDSELVDILRNKFKQDGINLLENLKFNSVTKVNDEIHLEINTKDGIKIIKGSDLLIAAGRAPDVSSLNLEKANVAYTSKGIEVDNTLKTTNKSIYAIGDVIGQYQFTHIAGYHASIVIKRSIFLTPAKIDYSAIPWATYTSPELAHVGMTEEQAKAFDKKSRVLTFDFSENDRAQTDNATLGKIKVYASKSGYVLGASILGSHASELLMPWSIAITQKIKLKDLAGLIVAYPTLSEINKFVAGSFYKELLFSKKTKSLVKLLNRVFS